MDPHLFVLFGATGDLAAVKLFPALYHVTTREGAPEPTILGVGRSDWDDARLQAAAVSSLTEGGVDESDARAWAVTHVTPEADLEHLKPRART